MFNPSTDQTVISQAAAMAACTVSPAATEFHLAHLSVTLLRRINALHPALLLRASAH